MTNKTSAGRSLRLARARCVDFRRDRSSVAGLAAAALTSLVVVGTGFPASGQEANRLGLCELGGETVTALQADVADAIESADPSDVEVAFVVVYSINNDNHGQPLNGVATGPILCANTELVGAAEAAQTDQIPAEGTEGTVDIRDSSEAFVLRYQPSGTPPGPAEARFCHTTNANVDCIHLSPDLFD